MELTIDRTDSKPALVDRYGIGGPNSVGIRSLQPSAHTPGHAFTASGVGVAAVPGKEQIASQRTVDTKALLRAAVLLTMTVAAFFLFFSSGVEADSAPRSTVLHVVKQGDTLWNLAAQSTPAGGDVRATVDLIRELNELSTSGVVVGDSLHVPASR